MYKRILKIGDLSISAFLLGPRQTGKTSLLKNLGADLFVDLLDNEQLTRYQRNPKLLFEQLSALAQNSKVVLDEIQRLPELLDYVQMSMQSQGHQFFLSGSSARRLKRSNANLLGGRAADLRLHPLCQKEIGKDFFIELALSFGTLPHIYNLVVSKKENEARILLKSYVSTYLHLEIQAEALVRNQPSFVRFLDIAAQSHAEVIEYSNIAKDAAVPASTIKEYYQILEDTLIGFYLWPYDKSERKKARGKFYFFDCGIVRAIQNRLSDPPTPSELGHLFEGWMLNELIRLRDYLQKPHRFSFWRHGKWEIDFIVENADGMLLAIECKSNIRTDDLDNVLEFKRRYPHVKTIVASLKETQPRTTTSGIEILPFLTVLENFASL